MLFFKTILTAALLVFTSICMAAPAAGHPDGPGYVVRPHTYTLTDYRASGTVVVPAAYPIYRTPIAYTSLPATTTKSPSSSKASTAPTASRSSSSPVYDRMVSYSTITAPPSTVTISPFTTAVTTITPPEGAPYATTTTGYVTMSENNINGTATTTGGYGFAGLGATVIAGAAKEIHWDEIAIGVAVCALIYAVVISLGTIRFVEFEF
ncbi:hypothetical protein ABW21_db0202696 [Orbilia brochopaga]|nr:hypothetical protein ABW21_db0202696 [Drechslerella brochopaga]